MTLLISSPLLDTSLCILDLRARTRDAVLGELVQHFSRAGSARDPGLVREALLRRERYASTAAGKGLALPNARTLGARESRIVVARAPRGIEWDAADTQPVQIVCAVLSPAEWSEDSHHEALGRVHGALRLQRPRQRLLEAANLPAFQAVWRELLA